MSIGETLGKGCHRFARKKIYPNPKKGKMLNPKP
jgi:hypothetical protein